MTPWYQATAIIEPIPEGAVENRVEGGIGGFAGGGMSSFLMSTGMDSQAQEYLTILRSYTFNTGVAMRHNLTDDLLQDEKRPKTERKLKMKLFDILKGRFKVDYSIQGHNLSVHFIDLRPDQGAGNPSVLSRRLAGVAAAGSNPQCLGGDSIAGEGSGLDRRFAAQREPLRAGRPTGGAAKAGRSRGGLRVQGARSTGFTGPALFPSRESQLLFGDAADAAPGVAGNHSSAESGMRAESA